MSDIYVYSGAVGTASGADWANAKTTLTAGASAASAADRLIVADDHAESSSTAQTITFPSTNTGQPNIVLCVSRTGSVPPVDTDLRTTATVTTTGANAINLNGSVYCYGITFTAGSGSSLANLVFNSANAARRQTFEQCAFRLGSTNAANTISLGGLSSTSSRVEWNNCTVQFGATGQSINRDASVHTFVWRNKSGSTAITGATFPTTLFSSTGAGAGVTLRGLDLSSLTGTIFGFGGQLNRVINCKLNASVTIGSPSGAQQVGVQVLGSGSSTIAERNEWPQYVGTLTTETTIVRTSSGASDGTTAYSWKMVSTANSSLVQPLDSFDGGIWNDDVGVSKTLTVRCITDNVTLNDNELFLEATYLGSSGSPLSTLLSTAPATILTTGSALATSATTWNTTGLTTPVYQKLTATFTPQMAGLVGIRVKLAKPSTTVYVDPPSPKSLV